MGVEGGRDGHAEPPTRDAAIHRLVWDWPSAFRGALYAIPAAVVIPIDVPRGLALAVGVLPAAIIGLSPSRRARVISVVLGILIGASFTIGSILGQAPIVAVLAIFVLCVAAAILAEQRRIGQLALTLCLPMVAIGLSFSAVVEGIASAGLIIAGSVYAYLLSLLWPDRPPTGQPDAHAGPPASMVGYGIRLGAAGSVAAAIGFVLDLDHPGWPSAAALLVMRPSPEMLRLRSIGRFVSVLLGAVAAVTLVLLEPAPAVFGLAAAGSVMGAAATHASAWYVTPGFTTFVVFLLMLYSSPQDAGRRVVERVGATAIGVGLALVFGLILPRWQTARGELSR